jgi:hypothetical protein
LTIAITSNRLLIGDQPSQLVREALLETCGECRVLALIKFLEALAHVSPNLSGIQARLLGLGTSILPDCAI